MADNDMDDRTYWSKVFLGGFVWGLTTGLFSGFIFGALALKHFLAA